jgi:hypothetical protein
MRIVADSVPAVYAYGQDRAHTAGRCPPAYVPLAKQPCPVCESTDCLCAPERWDADERAEWLDAEMADSRRESGGGW